MNNFFDTIAAISTPLAKGGIGVIRISGDNALIIAQKLFNKKIIANRINHGFAVFEEEKIDEVVLLYFKAPNSYTGEDVVEFQTHGSPVVIKKILELILKFGARHAMRGEFTKRAFLNGKMDLSEAEAVLDLIDAKTVKSASKSAANLSGALSGRILKIKEQIVEILAKITASIDFPEDVQEVSHNEILLVLKNVKNEIEKLLEGASAHNVLREGIKAAVAGRPNVGKSSLFNALLGLERAIVTDIEGTTRDLISETFEIEGMPVTLIDTAGIREKEAKDKAEQIGIKQAKLAVEEADIVLLLYDSTCGLTPLDKKIFKLAKNKKSIIVSTKADIADFEPEDSDSILFVSAKTGKNLDLLKKKIYASIIQTDIEMLEFTTNQRQQQNLYNALYALNNAIDACNENQMEDLISIDIKAALIALGEITGEVINDEILDGIFEKFCIGK